MVEPGTSVEEKKNKTAEPPRLKQRSADKSSYTGAGSFWGRALTPDLRGKSTLEKNCAACEPLQDLVKIKKGTGRRKMDTTAFTSPARERGAQIQLDSCKFLKKEGGNDDPDAVRGKHLRGNLGLNRTLQALRELSRTGVLLDQRRGGRRLPDLTGVQREAIDKGSCAPKN